MEADEEAAGVAALLTEGGPEVSIALISAVRDEADGRGDAAAATQTQRLRCGSDDRRAREQQSSHAAQ